MSSSSNSNKVSRAESVGLEAALVEQYNGPAETSNLEAQRTQSVIQRVQTSFSFFNEKLKTQRKSTLLSHIKIYLIMGTFILLVFSIYWGASYQRETRYKNLRMLVVIEDNETVNGTEPVIGNAVRSLLETLQVKKLGGWEIKNTTEFEELAQSFGHDSYGEIKKQIHHQEYWAAIYVRANATYNLKTAIENGDTLYDVLNNSIICYYETGRDNAGMSLYVLPNIYKVERYFLQQQSNITQSMFSGDSLLSVFSSLSSVAVAAAPLKFLYIDAIPFTDPVLTAPLQVGLIYMIIVTFFAFNMFGQIHQAMAASGVKKPHWLLYRVISSITGYFFISFFYSLVTLAFQVNFQSAFGKSGWLVYWMTNFLAMWALGAMNEMMAMTLIILYPPIVGFWLLFWVVINISATFAPIALCPAFFRYSYAMPVHAAYEIMKVIFFNTYKGALGRNYAILVIWIVLATTGMAVVAVLFGKTMGKRAMADRKKIEEQVLAKKARDDEEKIEFGRN